MQWDVAAQGPRKNKLIAERRLPKGTMDIACLSDVDMYDISLSGALETIDESKLPNLKNAVATLRKPYSVPHIYSGMAWSTTPTRRSRRRSPICGATSIAARSGWSICLHADLHGGDAAAGGTLSDFEPGKKTC